MSTAAQIAANRGNAQKSTGPKTVDGKAASSQNNFKYGFTGGFSVIAGESQAFYDALLTGLCEEHCPATVTETLLIHKMAQHHWLARRAQDLQDTTWFPENPMTDEERLRLFAIYTRYQTTHDRAFYKALNELQKLKAEKSKTEIGFESQKRRQAAEEAAKLCHVAAETRRQEDETRKREAHQARVRLQNSKAERNELNTQMSRVARQPGNSPVLRAATFTPCPLCASS